MPAITYYTLTPLASDSISDTQPKINQNFIGTNAWTAVDHEEFASPNAGFHKKVTLTAQSPAPSFTGTQLGIYNFVNPTTTKNEIYVTKYNNNVLTDIPITASSFNNASGSQDSGYSYLPSGLILKWGLKDVTLSSNVGSITFPSPFPVNALNGQLTLGVTNLIGKVAVIYITNLTANLIAFRVESTSTLPAQVQVSYNVIGY